MKSVQTQLEALGLGEKEVKAYLAALALGPATAQQIAAKAAIERPSAYVAIGALTERALMSSFVKGKKKYFTAEGPEKLLGLVREEKRKLAEKEERLKEVMPELEALISLSVEKPEVKYYEGLAGLEAMREVIFESKAKTIDVVGFVDSISKYAPAESRILHNVRLKKAGITGRFIIQTNKKVDSPPAVFDNWKYRKSAKKIVNGAEIAVFDDYLTLIVYRQDPFGFLIRSTEIAESARNLYELAWRGATPINLRK